MWVTIGFIALIAAVVISIGVGSATTSGTALPAGRHCRRHRHHPGPVGRRGKLEAFRLDQQEGRIRTALAAGQLSSTDADTLLSDIATAKTNVATTAIDDLIDLTYKGQLATKQGVAPAPTRTSTPRSRRMPRHPSNAPWTRSSWHPPPATPPQARRRRTSRTPTRPPRGRRSARRGHAVRDVASQYSTDASKDKGGDYGLVTKDSTLDPTWVAGTLRASRGRHHRHQGRGRHLPHRQVARSRRAPSTPASRARCSTTVGDTYRDNVRGGPRGEARGQDRRRRVRRRRTRSRRRDLPGRRSHRHRHRRQRRGQGQPHPLLAQRRPAAAPGARRRRPGLGGRGGGGAEGRRRAARRDRHRQPHQGLRGQRQGRERRHRQRRRRRRPGLLPRGTDGAPSSPTPSSTTRTSSQATSSGPVKSQFGYHVILFEDRTPAVRATPRRVKAALAGRAPTSPRSPRSSATATRPSRRRAGLASPPTSCDSTAARPRSWRLGRGCARREPIARATATTSTRSRRRPTEPLDPAAGRGRRQRRLRRTGTTPRRPQAETDRPSPSDQSTCSAPRAAARR